MSVAFREKHAMSQGIRKKYLSNGSQLDSVELEWNYKKENQCRDVWKR